MSGHFDEYVLLLALCRWHSRPSPTHSGRRRRTLISPHLCVRLPTALRSPESHIGHMSNAGPRERFVYQECDLPCTLSISNKIPNLRCFRMALRRSTFPTRTAGFMNKFDAMLS